MASSTRRGRADRRAAARDQARQQRRRRQTATQRRAERRARRRAVAGRAVAAAAAIALVVGLGWAIGRVWSATVGKETPGHLGPTTQLAAYAIDYRVEFTNGHVVNTDHHVVLRPLRSLYTTTRKGELVTGSIVNDRGLWFFQPPKWQLITPGGATAGDDPQPTLALRAGIARHQVKVMGSRTIIGRRCTMVRSGSPLGETFKKPTARNHTDLCVDGNDLILDYRWTLDGKLAETMRAVRVDVNPDVGDAVFTPTPTNDTQPPVTATALTEDTRSKLSPRFDAPAELRYLGGWVRVEQGGDTPVPRLTESLLYRSGEADAVEVRYGPGDAEPNGVEVGLAGGRRAQLSITLDRSTLTIPTTAGQAVRLVGRDPDQLVRLAGSFAF